MRLKQFRLTLLPMLGGGVLILFAVLATAQTRNTAAVALTEADLHFPGTFSPDLPYDVNPAKLAAALADDLKTALAQPPSEEMRVPKSQRLFDIFAWQAFLALNWPADASGNSERAKTLVDTGPRVWEYWIETSHVFKLDGADPDPWPRTLADAKAPMVRTKAAWTTSVRADQNLQAFSGPLVDQNGKWVRYQVKINREEFDYLVENKLYNLDGQIEFSRDKVVSFPSSDFTTRMRGAIELKMAWKELGPGDIPTRFYTVEGEVKNNDTGMFETRWLGLVGMHIAMRTKTSPQWLWATFEHVDNVNANELETGVTTDGRTVPLRPNFNNPSLPTVIPNVLPPKDAVLDAQTGLPREPRPGETPNAWFERLTTTPVQVTRVIPIPASTARLNTRVVP